MPGVIKKLKAENNAKLISQYAEKVVFPSEYVKMHFNKITNVKDDKVVIAPQGLFNENNYKNNKDKARIELRQKLNIPEDGVIVLGVGYADIRKGIDLFVEVGLNVIARNEKVYFIWVGNQDKHLLNKIMTKINKTSFNDKILFINAQEDISLFYSGSDIYLMTSREDPFPSVVLEAMDAGLPVIGFKDAGGFVDIVTKDTGILVPYLDIEEMSNKAVELINDNETRILMSKNSSILIDEKFKFVDYVYLLLEILDHNYRKVSVIVPNYNYGNFLEDRLTSVINQTYPIYEIVFLDDASSDNSIDILNDIKSKYSIDLKLFENAYNSGSVFKQWIKGISIVTGDYIWIAEADDLCENNFLEEVVKGFNNKDVILSYSQSKQIDYMGKTICKNYLKYTDDICVHKWKKDYIIDGIEEISTTLVVKNTIPNVSAVVFKKVDIEEIIEELTTFKIAGDWFFYVWLLQKGSISYIAMPLNINRRHNNNVTKRESSILHDKEVVKMQNYIINKFF